MAELPIDYWNDPVDEVLRRSVEAEFDYDDPRGVVRKTMAALSIRERREEIEADLSAAIFAIADCAVCGLPMPPWLAAPFVDAVRSVQALKAKDWNEAFGSPNAGLHRGQLQQQKRWKWALRIELERHRRSGKAGRPSAQVLADSIGASASTTRRLLADLQQERG